MSVGDGALTLHADCLFSKWGFNDGDEPDALLDLCDELDLEYPSKDRWHATLRQLVRARLLPVLDHRVEKDLLGYRHIVEPEFVEVPWLEVLSVLKPGRRQ